MRTDFAEERRWMMVEACEFAIQVVEWHLTPLKERGKLMVGGRGWGESNAIAIPGHPGYRSDVDVPLAPGSAEADVEMLVDQQGQAAGEGPADGNRMDAGAAEVLEDIMGRQGPVDDTIDGGEKADEGGEGDFPDKDAEGELDAEGESDAGGGGADAVGGVNAGGEGGMGGALDALGEADPGDGVVGLEGE